MASSRGRGVAVSRQRGAGLCCEHSRVKGLAGAAKRREAFGHVNQLPTSRHRGGITGCVPAGVHYSCSARSRGSSQQAGRTPLALGAAALTGFAAPAAPPARPTREAGCPAGRCPAG